MSKMSIVATVLIVMNIAMATLNKEYHSVFGWLCALSFALAIEFK